MSSRKLTYNIPGCGNLTANIFDYTQSVYDFLDSYGHIGRFRRINQLGRLREVFQGAHHNRYEYVFLQLSLISELCEHKKSDLGLSSTRDFCGQVSSLEKPPTLGELLQCLVLLSNMGYLEGTFATSRAWVSFLKGNKDAFNAFSKGLDQVDRADFKAIIDNYSYYRFSLVMALFQLQRYRRKGDDMSDFCSRVIRCYLSKDTSDFQILQLRELFNSIRQLAFITLDSFYAPVPFKLDLSSIILNFDSLQESLFIKNTSYRVALNNLAQVLQDSVYLSSDACLNTSRASEDVFHLLTDGSNGLTKISDIYRVVCPNCVVEKSEGSVVETDWIREKKLILEFTIEKSKKVEALNDELRWETAMRSKLGKTKVRVSLLKNAKNTVVKFVVGLLTEDNRESLISMLKSVTLAVSVQRAFADESCLSNNDALVGFILKGLFGWDRRYIAVNKVRSTPALLISDGRLALEKKIDEYLTAGQAVLSADEIFEVEKMKDLVQHLKYSGLTVCYVGSIRIFNEGKKEEAAELDGLLLCPTASAGNNFGHILEAKNYNNGVTEAKKQLEKKVRAILQAGVNLNIDELNNRAAFGSCALALF